VRQSSRPAEATAKAAAKQSGTTPNTRSAGVPAQADAAPTSVTVEQPMTTREKLHLLVDDLTDAEAEAAGSPRRGCLA
jgi:hypothetical protein